MQNRKTMCILVCLLIVSSVLSSQEKIFVKAQLIKPQKLILDMEDYFLGKSLSDPTSKDFYEPILGSLITVVKNFEPMLGFKAEEALQVINADIDAKIGDELVKIRIEYSSDEQAKKAIQLIVNFLNNKAQIKLKTSNEGDVQVFTHPTEENKFYLSSTGKSVYIQVSKTAISPDDKKNLHKAISPNLKNDTGSYLNVHIPVEALEENNNFLDELGPLTLFMASGFNTTIHFDKGYYQSHSAVNIPNKQFFQKILSTSSLSKQNFSLIPNNAEIALGAKFDFVNIISNLRLLKEFKELNTIEQNIDMVLNQFKAMTNIDLQNEILKNLGEEIYISNIPHNESGGTPLLSLFGLNNLYITLPTSNSAGLKEALKKLFTVISQFNSMSPIFMLGDGIKEIKAGEYDGFYLKFANSIITPCFLFTDNALFIATNTPTLKYIAKNHKTWGSIIESTEFTKAIPQDKKINSFFYQKFIGDPNRINYSAHILNTAVFGGMIFVSHMGNEKINPGFAGMPFREPSRIIAPIVSSIDFSLYPPNKAFYQPIKDNYFYSFVDGNHLHTYSINGHFINATTSPMTAVAVMAIVSTIAVPQLISARKNANEKAVIGNLRTVMTDQETYKNDNDSYATLQQLANDHKVDLTSPKVGYRFYDLMTPDGDFYGVGASPIAPGSSGNKHYFCSVAGKVRCSWEEESPIKQNSLKAEQASIDLIEAYDEAR